MLRSRFLWKLYAGYVALILASALVVSLLHGRQVGDDALAETEDVLRAQALLLREIAWPVLGAGEPDAGFQARIEGLGKEIGIRLTVIRHDGRVVADSAVDPSALDDHGSRPEVLAARATGRAATARRLSATLGEPMVYCALPVRRQEQLLGFARTARPAASLELQVASRFGSSAIGVLSVAALACLVALLVARGLSHRLSSMTEVAQAMARGERRRRVEPMGTDEVGALARALNTMAQQLERRLEKGPKDRADVLAILESMVEGVIAVDRDQRILLINDEARRLLGVADAQVTGRPIWEVTRVQPLSEMLDLSLHLARRTQNEISLPLGDDELCVVLHSTPLRDETGAVTGAVMVLLDITDMRRLESVRRDFVTNVSHELKTPLTSIRGYVETLLDDPEADPETRQRFLGKISDQANRLSTLVSDLLTLARVESAGHRMERRTLDLREPARAAVALLAPRAQEANVELHTELAERAVLVQGDPETLRQVVDNLLDNAIKYTPAGGKIWLRVFERDGEAVLEVRDTGVGLEPKHRERVFERFYRVDSARTRVIGGTGLGLSIVKHVAHAHRGRVELESAVGSGSTFRVRLPRTG